jgi:hypothetical protein
MKYRHIEWTAEDQSVEVSWRMAEPNSRGAGFFAVDRRNWARICDSGTINEAVAYLVLAQGTGRDNSCTSWSVTSLKTYAGISWDRGTRAIAGLISKRFIEPTEKSTKGRPRYRIVPAAGDADPIWLPNTLVTGTANGEDSPIRRLRAAGDMWALRLLVDLYYAHNLRDDGGISPHLIRAEFDRIALGEHGIFNVWGFRSKGYSLWFSGPLEAHRARPKINSDLAVWSTFLQLQREGLLSVVPHLWENDSLDAEVIHAIGSRESGEPLERELASEASRAAMAMIPHSKAAAAMRGGYFLVPVVNTLPNVQMIGVARLRYRPHTKRTSAWQRELAVNGRAWVERYREYLESAARRAG